MTNKIIQIDKKTTEKNKKKQFFEGRRNILCLAGVRSPAKGLSFSGLVVNPLKPKMLSV